MPLSESCHWHRPRARMQSTVFFQHQLPSPGPTAWGRTCESASKSAGPHPHPALRRPEKQRAQVQKRLQGYLLSPTPRNQSGRVRALSCVAGPGEAFVSRSASRLQNTVRYALPLQHQKPPISDCNSPKPRFFPIHPQMLLTRDDSGNHPLRAELSGLLSLCPPVHASHTPPALTFST